jgi:hypothetical protein
MKDKAIVLVVAILLYVMWSKTRVAKAITKAAPGTPTGAGTPTTLRSAPVGVGNGTSGVVKAIQVPYVSTGPGNGMVSVVAKPVSGLRSIPPSKILQKAMQSVLLPTRYYAPGTNVSATNFGYEGDGSL